MRMKTVKFSLVGIITCSVDGGARVPICEFLHVLLCAQTEKGFTLSIMILLLLLFLNFKKNSLQR